MSDSFTEPASVAQDIIRTLFSTLDRPAYWLLGLVYELFFNVASADLFSNDTIMKFYGRVQIILGVFMMFQLAMTILKGIVSPDTFISKDKGVGNLITRIATALILITLLMPISIPSPKNEYEIQINNNGLLFGTLYSLQHRILANNTLGRLVLGTNDDNSFVATQGSNDTELKKSARIFTSTILKGFYRINLVPEDQRDTTYLNNGDDPAIYNANRVCKDIDSEVLAAYTRIDADPGEIISLVNATCDSDVKPGFLNNLQTGFQKLIGTTKYVFAYMPVISTIVAVVFVFILLSFTIDVSVRAVKLAVLRLIAPIPIISYMDPKGGKDSAFSSWVKALSSTYLDIFIRLAVVYFVIFLIQDMIINGIVIDVGTGVLGVISHIVIWIGLFIFAKQAPKFIKQVLGMKDDGGKLFGGFGEMLAVGAAGAGIIGSAATNYRASKEENDALHPNSGFNVLRNAGSAIAGAIGGGYTGLKALGGKDASAKSVMAAQNQRNAMRAAHSTFPGRLASTGYGLFTGQTLATKGNNVLKGAQDWVKAQGDFKSALEDEARAQGGAVNLGGGIVARYEELERAVASAHDGKVTIGGTDYDSNMFTKSFMDDALKAQVRSYQSGTTKAGGTAYSSNIAAGGKLYKKREDAIRTAKDVDVSELSDQSVAANFKNYNVDQVDTYGKAIGAANNVISDQQNSMKQRMRIANDQNKK